MSRHVRCVVSMVTLMVAIISSKWLLKTGSDRSHMKKFAICMLFTQSDCFCTYSWVLVVLMLIIIAKYTMPCIIILHIIHTCVYLPTDQKHNNMIHLCELKPFALGLNNFLHLTCFWNNLPLLFLDWLFQKIFYCT